MPQIIVFIKPDTSESDITVLINKLKSNSSFSKIVYHKKEEALQDFLQYINVNENDAGSIKSLIPGNIEITTNDLDKIKFYSTDIKTNNTILDVKTIDNNAISLAEISKILIFLISALSLILTSIFFIKIKFIIRALRKLTVSHINSKSSHLNTIYVSLIKILGFIFSSSAILLLITYTVLSKLSSSFFSLNDFRSLGLIILIYSSIVIIVSTSIVPIIFKPLKKNEITNIL